VAERNDANEPFFRLGGKKRITVRTWKKQVLIDIREFYTAEEDPVEKPGKKGISLSMAQWEALKAAMDGVEEAIRNV